MNTLRSKMVWQVALALVVTCLHSVRSIAEDVDHGVQGGLADLVREAKQAIQRASAFYIGQVATHGGYVYFYSVDLSERWGEGKASVDQIWVQPPGTPTVGKAFLRAYEATGEKQYLSAAVAAARALCYGQLESGGWTNCIDFDPAGARVARYRHGSGRGKNNSSLDDGQTQAALQLLFEVDQALQFKDDTIHDAARFGLDALLQAQFPNGAFPQVWNGTKPTGGTPMRATFPAYDWRTDNRVKEYWHLYTLNDDLALNVAATLRLGLYVYDEPRCKHALDSLGEFLLMAQLPDPQPAWAQQYTLQMHPAWARKFEPPAVATAESQGVVETLLDLYEMLVDAQQPPKSDHSARYLKAAERAVHFLSGQVDENGQMPRYIELQSNRPLYMKRRGDIYTLTYDSSNLPNHYGWHVASRLPELEQRIWQLKAERVHAATKQGSVRADEPESLSLAKQARAVIDSLDTEGRWHSVSTGERLIGQNRFPTGDRYLSSQVFSDNIQLLAEFVKEATGSQTE